MGLSGVVLLLLGLAVWQTLQVAKMKQRWNELLQDASGQNLERMLYDHLRDRVRMETDFQNVLTRLGELETKMNTSKRFIGVVRYDAFPDVGGSQSFSMAIYDDQGNGTVITSIVGRSDCRVFSKPLVAGRSEFGLSKEESQAIQSAVSSTPRSLSLA